MKIVFQVNGGIGKSIAATAVCSAIKTQYPGSELIVITGYPEVFAGNRKVSMILRPDELSYFYKNHVENIYCYKHLTTLWSDNTLIIKYKRSELTLS